MELPQLISCILTLVVTLTGVCGVSQEPWDSWPKAPHWTEKPQMARYLVHYGFWGIVSSFSPEYMSPFGTLQSYADGPLDQSSGIPYFYISKLSDTYRNVAYNSTASFTVSMAESQKCRDVSMDPEEPPCARVTLVGKFVPLQEEHEKDFARKALFKRHPTMTEWPPKHDWTLYKIELKAVHLLDYYGGASHVSLKDYFAATPTTVSLENKMPQIQQL